MVRASKSDKQSVAPVPVENVVVETKAPKAKKPKAEKTDKVVAPVVVVAPVENVVVEPEPVVEAVDAPLVAIKLQEFSGKLQQCFTFFSSLKNEFKTLEKAVTRDMKIAQKSASKKSKRNGNRQPSGFVKPTLISDELAQFLGKTVGTEMARTEVSKEINQYIRTNSLQDKANGRKINPDASLAKLLKLTAADELTYFNLQRYMKHHFIKTEAVAV